MQIRSIRRSLGLAAGLALVTTAWSPVAAEHELASPQVITVDIVAHQVTSVTGPARRHIDPSQGIDRILFSDLEGTFRCGEYRDLNPDPGVVGFWFGDPQYELASRQEPAPNQYVGRDWRERPLIDTSMLVDYCLSTPPGTMTEGTMHLSLEMGAYCYAPHQDFLDDPPPFYTKVNDATFRLQVHCDRTLIAASVEPLGGGTYRHMCPEGWHISSTHREQLELATESPRFCRQSQPAIEFVVPVSDEPFVRQIYQYSCPDGYYVRDTSSSFVTTYDRLAPDEQWCYPYSAYDINQRG